MNHKNVYTIRTCQMCSLTKSSRWYLGNICRGCRRKQLRDTPQVLKTREVVQFNKLNPECWDCGSESASRWYKDHTQCPSCQSKEYNVLNKEKVAITTKKYRLANKEKINAKKRLHRQKTGSHRVDQKLRKARKRSATVKWVNKDDLRRIYKECPENMTVDHIIPLKNDLICGLHVPENLQYLTMSDNAKKWNKFDGTIDNNSWRNECQKR